MGHPTMQENDTAKLTPTLYTSNGLKYPTQIMGSIGLQFTF